MSNSSKITTILFLTVLITYSSMVFISESIYRNPLFEKSLTIQKEWQNNQTDSLGSFFHVITKFSTDVVYLQIILIVFIFMPINKAYTLVSTLAYSGYLSNFLKIIYASPRPFFIDPELFKECQGSYGNPSTQTLMATSFYLSLWHLITDYQIFTKNLIGQISDT